MDASTSSYIALGNLDSRFSRVFITVDADVFFPNDLRRNYADGKMMIGVCVCVKKVFWQKNSVHFIKF